MKYKLGEFIEAVDERNSQNRFGADSVRGISTDKKFIGTKAKLDGVKLTSYKLSLPNTFAYVADTSRRGDKMSLAYNNTDETYLVSSISTVFQVVKSEKLNSDYLYMYFNRPEFDRFARYNSWGSARETFSWDDMCDIDIDLPPLEIQEKYVAVYKSLLDNQQAYENGLGDLKLVCDATIEKIRHEMVSEKIGKYLQRENKRNLDMKNNNVLGLSTKKQFRKPNSRVNKKALSKYKIVEKNWFAFVPTTDTWKVFAFGLNKENDQIVVSPIYEVFSIIDSSKLLPEYLAMWFKRKEFDRYVRFHSWGSARENYNFEELKEVKIPIPDINVQKSIIEIYNAYNIRRELNEQLKNQIKDICPILINGAIREGKAYVEV